VDQQLVTRIFEFTKRTKGAAWIQDAWDDYQDEFASAEKSDTWFWTCLPFHYGGRDDEDPTLLEQFLATRPSLTPMEKILVRAHQQIRLSIFSIEDVKQGEAILLEDLLCPARFWVLERSMAQLQYKHLVILGRLAQVGDDCILLGANVHPLTPAQAEPVCARVRQLMSRRAEEPTPERLRHPELVMEMSDYWRVQLEDRRPPQWVNNDGEKICWVRDQAEMLKGRASSAPAPSGPEVDAFLQNYRRQWAEKWVDESVPALQGRSPRQAVSDAEGRRQVEVLLREFEYHEAKLPPAQAFDMNEIRRELGLPVQTRL
jgi:hypothetical protein